MRVLYVSDALAKGQRFGLGRYAQELAESVAREAPDIRLVPVAPQVEPGAPEAVEALPGGRKLLAGAWTTLGLPLAEWVAPPFDVLHSVEMAYPIPTRKPEVVTIHDLGPLTHPEWFSQARPRLKRAALKRAAERAACVICVSQATADAYVSLAGPQAADRVRVIHEGVSPFFFEAPEAGDLAGLDLPPEGTPFFLWMGSKINPRKNLERIVEGFERASGEVPHHLVLAGGIGWDAEPMLDRVRRSPVADRVHRPGFVTDAQLRALYARTTGMLYVSLLEGFGLPILESMASGGPVVTSSVSSMPEVAGDAALLVDPTDADAIAGAIASLATDGALRQRLRAAGRARARTFDWGSCARRVAAVYRDVA
jgi:glycosyltransferase involved in cell wall biosynthesis